MAVAKFVQTDFTTQTAANYKAYIDADMMVAEVLVNEFAPHQQNSPDMTIRIEAGRIFTGVGITWVGGQNTAVITAPTVNPRIDRVVMDPADGALTVITGAEAGSPVPPAITLGSLPVCRVLLQTTSTEITNDMITDERALVGIGGAKPAVGVFRASPQTIPNAALTAIEWTSEDFDEFGLHDNVTNPSRLAVPQDGKYLIAALVGWATADCVRALYVRANGTDTYATKNSNHSGALGQSLSVVRPLTAGDYIEILVFQSSGGDLYIVASAYQLQAQMIYLGP